MKNQTEKKKLAGAIKRMSGEMRRGQIAEAAVRLFAEYGFSGTTTREIALAAGISEASLFQHFGTKADLYAEILDCKTKRIYETGWMEEIGEHIAGNEDEKVLRAIASKITEYCRADPDFIRLMLYTALEKHENAQPFRRRLLYPVFELLRDYIEKRKADGAFQDCNSEAAAFAFISTQIYFAMGSVLFRSRMLTVGEDEALSNFIRLTLDGLRSRAVRVNLSKKDFCREKQK